MSTTPPPTAASGLRGKVFGIGLARTGTTSLHEAMQVLGLRSAPDSVPLLGGIDLDFLRSHDAFFDNPVPFRYEALEAACPDSRWIVTQRPIEEWLGSMEWLFGPGLDRLDANLRQVGDRVHRDVYGSAVFDPERLRSVYERHYEKLETWVEGRETIWINVDEGFRWEPICNLLSLPVPPVEFPHANRRRRKPSLRRSIKRQ